MVITSTDQSMALHQVMGVSLEFRYALKRPKKSYETLCLLVSVKRNRNTTNDLAKSFDGR